LPFVASLTKVIDHALQSITDVIAYGVRVSAYGIVIDGLIAPRDHGIGVIAHGQQ
jgi:hypothetical protein